MSLKTLLSLLLIVLLSAACVPQTPVPVFVTPTPAPTSEATPDPTPVDSAAVNQPAPLTVAEAERPIASHIEAISAGGQAPAVGSGTVLTDHAGFPVQIAQHAGAASISANEAGNTAVLADQHQQPMEQQPTLVDPTTPPTPMPTVTWRGPVIGPDYRVPTILPPTPIGPATQPPVAPPVSTPPPITLPLLDPEQMGIQLDINLTAEDWREALARIEQIGVKWIKVQIPWRDVQPDGPNQNDSRFFLLIEQHLQEANRRGFHVLVSFAKAPAWARSVHLEDGPPDNPQDLANFIRLFFQRVNPGLARDAVGEYVNAVEIWNEPNLRREWQGVLPFSGSGYMQLFAPAYQAVREYSATMPIITAGLAPTGTNPGSIDDRQYLRQMYAAGLGSYRDIYIGVHPYSWGNSPDAACCDFNPERGWDDDPHFFFSDTIREYREIMVANGHADVQMWVTEFGWATWDGFPGQPTPDSLWMLYNDKWTQAQYTIRAFEIGQSTDYIGPMILWNLNFALLSGMIDNRDERAAYSLLVPGTLCVVDVEDENITERPLFWMLYDAVRPDIQLDSYCG
jgi:hypothetical protein